MNTPAQIPLPFRPHGGLRRHAGRKPKGDKALVNHLSRPRFDKITPAHVTLRLDQTVPSLRSSRRFAVVRRCFAAAKGKFGLRLVEFSVLSDHLHLIVEADSNESLSRGMQGLNIRLAKALNAALGRTGHIFADHYHARLLLTPTDTASAIAYVLGNASRHYGNLERGEVDVFTSTSSELRWLLAFPKGWLLTAGVYSARMFALNALRKFPGW